MPTTTPPEEPVAEMGDAGVEPGEMNEPVEPPPVEPPPVEPPPMPVGPTEAELLSGSWSVYETQGDATQRHECGFGEVDGRLYLVGGRGNKDTDIYDPATNTWSVGASPPIELHHFQPVGYQGKLYVTAALTGGYPRENPVSDFHVYDPAMDEWSTGARIPAARERGSAGVAVYQDKFYVVSGIQDGHWAGWVPWFDVYDPATDTWEQLPDAPRSRDHVAVGIANNKLYVAGGRTSSRSTNEVFSLTIAPVDMYDFATGEWTTLPNDIPTQRAGNSTVVLGNYLVVIGGERANAAGSAEAVDTVEALDLTTNEWLELPSLNRSRHGTSAVFFDNKMYTAAGSAGGGGGPEVNTLEVWELP